MQQTKSYWRVVLVAGVVSAFLGAACTVTTSTDDGVGDAGEGSLAGAPSAGASGSGTAGTAGSATAGTGGTSFICDPAEAGATGTPDANACEMTQDQTDCDTCVRTKCCTEYANCYATDPGNQCGYGGPKDSGEFFCYQGCLQDAFTKNGTIEDSDSEACANNCVTSTDLMGSKECGAVLGTATNDLIGCVVDQGCATICYGG